MIHFERFVILWDWDNTLVNTRPAAAKALKQLALESGVPEPTEEQITNVIGTHFGQYWHNTYPKEVEKKLDRFLELYQEYSQDIQLFPETTEILSKNA
jgi:phosphoglycolate phosphatase-like HAD superfamily hydrolase